MTLATALAHIDYRDEFHADLHWTPVNADEFVGQFRAASPQWAVLAGDDDRHLRFRVRWSVAGE